jgi:putative addiction module component (TIGR02574 family)
MITINVCFHNDEDAELLINFLKTTRFKDEIEVFEDEYSAEDIAEWDRRLADHEADPSKAISLEQFKEEMKKKYGV